MKVQAASLSDTGPARENNEDVVLCEPGHGLYAVIDGMGGAAAGEVAAAIALKQITGRLMRPTDGRESDEERVREALTLASNAIYEQAQSRPEYRGMGCVATLALLAPDGRLTIGHVGDTRLYRIHGNSIEKLTSDHSPVGELEDADEITEEEAMRHPRRNQVFRDLGSEPHQAHDDYFIQIVEERLADNEALLLCSDGLTDVVRQEDILDLIKKNKKDPEKVVQSLVDRANQNSKDNVSVVYAQGPRFSSSRKASTSQKQPKTQDAQATGKGPKPAPARDTAVPPGTNVKPAGRPSFFRTGLLAGLLATAGGLGYWLSGRTPEPDAIRVGPADVATITEAILLAKPGSEVLIAPGTYRERLVLRDQVNLTAAGGAPVEIQAPAGLVGPLIQATNARVRLSGLRIDATRARQALVIRDGDLTIDNADLVGGTESAIEFNGHARALLQSSRVRTQGAGLIIRDTAEVRVDRTLFTPVTRKTAQPALIIESARLPELTGNWFIDFPEPIWSALELENRALDGNSFVPEQKSPVRRIQRGKP